MTVQSAPSELPREMYCATCERTYPSGERCPKDGTRLVRVNRPDPLIGRELDGRYTIVDRVGQGGMGAVYRAVQHSFSRDVAVKVMNAQTSASPEMIKRFLREASLASRLAHPNAVAVFDCGETDDNLYLVMELIRGRTLADVLAEESRLQPVRVIRIGMQICDALESAHALSIIHRDLKPTNIMVLSHGRDVIKILDFGLAKSLAPEAARTMTGIGAMLGTPAFMPPELATGQPCDGRADLYSLGCILFLAGTGVLPFQSESVNELIAMHGADRAPPMTGVPAELAKIVDKLLAKSPNERYQSASETREALEHCLDAFRALEAPKTTVEIETATTARRNAEPAPRGPWLALAVILIVAGAAAVGSALALPDELPPELVYGGGVAAAIGAVIGIVARIWGGRREVDAAPVLEVPPRPIVPVVPVLPVVRPDSRVEARPAEMRAAVADESFVVTVASALSERKSKAETQSETPPPPPPRPPEPPAKPPEPPMRRSEPVIRPPEAKPVRDEDTNTSTQPVEVRTVDRAEAKPESRPSNSTCASSR